MTETVEITFDMETIGRLRAHTGETQPQICRSIVEGSMLENSPPNTSTWHRWETGTSAPQSHWIPLLRAYAKRVGFNG